MLTPKDFKEKTIKNSEKELQKINEFLKECYDNNDTEPFYYNGRISENSRRILLDVGWFTKVETSVINETYTKIQSESFTTSNDYYNK